MQHGETTLATGAAREARAVVVVPCFNQGRFVADAVKSCLAQHSAGVRVVVVNDGSTDGRTPGDCDAVGKLDPERVRVLHQPNVGLPGARNAGAAWAHDNGWLDVKNDYFVFLDADDWIEPAFVSRLHQEMMKQGEHGADVSHVYCQERLVEKGSGIWRVPEWDPALLLVTNLHPVTALVRADRFFEAGGFDASMRDGYEDWDLWLNFRSRGWRGVRVREPLFIWRRHSEVSMVVEAVRRHSDLYACLMRKYAGEYEKSAGEILRLTNTLLRRADANWLDEEQEAIAIRDLRVWAKDVVKDRAKAEAKAEALRNELAAERARLAEAEARIERLENTLLRRVKRSVKKRVEGMPRPVSDAARAVMQWTRRAL
jgi:glycosyltransferase involved in cell wall biosynthesis